MNILQVWSDTQHKWLMLLWIFVVVQRLVELLIARKNGKFIKALGGIEYGKEHYKYFVWLHAGFLVCLLLEFVRREYATNPSVLFLLVAGFFGLQLLRLWCILSLGRFWNTRILVLPGAEVVRKGPYRFIRHPNYAVVCAELIVLSCIFHAYLTGIVFSTLNFFLISYRVSIEEAALSSHTNY